MIAVPERERGRELTDLLTRWTQYDAPVKLLDKMLHGMHLTTRFLLHQELLPSKRLG